MKVRIQGRKRRVTVVEAWHRPPGGGAWLYHVDDKIFDPIPPIRTLGPEDGRHATPSEKQIAANRKRRDQQRRVAKRTRKAAQAARDAAKKAR